MGLQFFGCIPHQSRGAFDHSTIFGLCPKTRRFQPFTLNPNEWRHSNISLENPPVSSPQHTCASCCHRQLSIPDFLHATCLGQIIGRLIRSSVSVFTPNAFSQRIAIFAERLAMPLSNVLADCAIMIPSQSICTLRSDCWWGTIGRSGWL